MKIKFKDLPFPFLEKVKAKSVTEAKKIQKHPISLKSSKLKVLVTLKKFKDLNSHLTKKFKAKSVTDGNKIQRHPISLKS